MEKVLFTKYNKLRSPKYQTRTRIVEENGHRYIEKSAVNGEGTAHIKHIFDAYSQIDKVYNKVFVLKPEKQNEAIQFPYIQGKTLDDVLAEKIGTAGFISYFNHVLDTLYDISTEFVRPFALTAEFERIFGCYYESDEPAVIPANVDMLFENVIVSEGKYVLFDYEWIFNFPIPIAYIKYRSLKHFFDSHAGELATLYENKQFFNLFGIDDKFLNLFNEMEESFEQYVYGKDLVNKYILGYYKPIKDLNSLMHEIDLKQVHIRNLETIIEKQKEELKDLKSQNSLLETQIQQTVTNKLKRRIKKLTKW